MDADRRAVGKEQQIEFPAFGGLGNLHRLREHRPGFGEGIGVTPCGDVLSGLVNEAPRRILRLPARLCIPMFSCPVFSWNDNSVSVSVPAGFSGHSARGVHSRLP
ncbi:MAG TPA: hypothetical protein VGC82_04945, partial [Rhodopila sp.]